MSSNDDIPLADVTSRPKFTTQRVAAIGGYKLLRDAIPDRFVISLSLLTGFGLACVPFAPRYLLASALGLYTLSIPLRAYLTHLGLLHNSKADGIVPGKVTVRWPPNAKTQRERRERDQSEDGNEEGEAEQQEEMCIVLLTARSNAPLGLFDPVFREIGADFAAMSAKLRTDPESGLLQVEPWTGRTRDTSNTLLATYYFASEEHVIRWARKGLHNSAWMKVARNPEKYRDIHLGHELFVVKAGTFEATYVNAEPQGAGAIWERVAAGQEGEKAGATQDVWRTAMRRAKGYSPKAGENVMSASEVLKTSAADIAWVWRQNHQNAA